MKVLKRTLSFILSAAMVIPALATYVPAKALEIDHVPYEEVMPLYNVDCGDFDVTSMTGGEEMGAYQSVTEQIYKADEVTGKMWGLVDDYNVTPPQANLNNSGTGGIQTNWTWPHENGGWSAASPKESTNRYTKNQYEERGNFGDTRKLDYSFELEPGRYGVEILAVDPWGCSKSPTVSFNGEAAKQMTAKTTFFAYVDVKEGSNKLDISFRGTGSSNLAVNIAYITITKSQYRNLYKAASSVNIDNVVYGDFELPVKYDDCSISWTSDSDAITVSGNQAAVKRENDDRVVNLKAIILDEKNYCSTERTYTVTVRGNKDINLGAGLKDFGEEDVRITDAYYNNSFDKEVDYLLLLDTDRLLAGFRETAAYAAGYSANERKEFMHNVKRYDGWENTRIGGHTLGHYMSSLSRAYTNAEATDEQRAALLEKINECSRGLRECQEIEKGSSYCKDGFLFGATIDNGGSTQLEYQFDRIEGKSNIGGDWVPWYTMHKILAGLVDIAKYTGNEDAKAAAADLGIWVYNRVSTWDNSMKSRVLGVEYGGMNDALYDLYAFIRNDEAYKGIATNILRAAEKFDEVTLFETVKNSGKNVLNNRHANTTIPKFIGALKRYMVLGESAEKYLEYAEKFWDMVISHHTYITGGNSENEHFGADDILYGEETTVNNETCNTYNMLKLTRELFKITGDAKYADYYENTLINAIMASQNPETGMSMYFQPMASGYHKVFGHETTDFWCCTGSGIENFTKLNDSIYYHDASTVVVAQYLSSELTWADKNIRIRQTSGIQTIDSDTAEFEVSSIDGNQAEVDIALRIPDWVYDCGNTMSVTVNGKTLDNVKYYDFNGTSTQERFVLVNAKSGDVINVTTPMEVVAKNLPDSLTTYAFKYGPVVISAKLGNDASKQTESGHGVMVRRSSTTAVSNDKIGIYAEDSVSQYMSKINSLMTKNGKVFKLTGANCDYEFVPHFSQYTDNYGIYWTYYVGAMDSSSIIRDKDSHRKERVTVDSLQAGYGQYEPGLDNSTGHIGSSTEHIRYATAGGYFEYEVKVKPAEKNYLLLTLRREDDGLPLYVTAGGTEILSKAALNSADGSAVQGMLSDADYKDYYQVKLLIPDSVVSKAVSNADGDKVIKVRFAGTGASESARLYNWSYCVTDYEKTNKITGLTIDGKTYTAAGDNVIVTNKDYVTVKALINDTKGFAAVNKAKDVSYAEADAISEGTESKIKLTDIRNDLYITAYAEDFSAADTIKVTVIYDMKDENLSGGIKKSFGFENELGEAKTVQKATVPSVINKTVSYTDSASAENGKALVMDGSYGLLLGDAAVLGESYTVSFFMKPDAVGGQYDPTFCAGVFDPEYWLNLTFDAKIWSNNNIYGKIPTPVSGAYKAGQWQHVALTVKKDADSSTGATGILYVNGKPVSQGNVVSGIMTNSNSKLYFGVNRWDALYRGAVDEIVMFNTDLTESQISALSNGYIGSDGKITDKYAAAYKEATKDIFGDEPTPTPPSDEPTPTPPSDEPTPTPPSDEPTPTKSPGNDATAAPSPTVVPGGSATAAPTPNVSSEPAVVEVGTTAKSGNVIYKVISNKSGAYKVTALKAAKKNLKKVVIPKRVKISGTYFNVTRINKSAFKNCKKLKTITIKSTKITKIGKKAFAGIAKKAVIKVPKSKKKAYKKLLKRAGYKGKVK